MKQWENTYFGGLAAGGANQKEHVFLMDGWFSLIMGGLGS